MGFCSRREAKIWFLLQGNRKLPTSPYSTRVNLGRHFFKKGQWNKFNEKCLIPQNTILQNCLEVKEENDTSNWKIEDKKENFEFRHHIGISVEIFLKIVQVLCFDPILSFYLILFIYFC